MDKKTVIEVVANDRKGLVTKREVTTIKEYHDTLISWFSKGYNHIRTLINGQVADMNNVEDAMKVYNNLIS